MLFYFQEVEIVATQRKDGWVQLPPFLVSEEMAQTIEDVQFEKRYRNRAEALRAIISAGIKAIRQDPEVPTE